jgi:hypothetical protein
LSTLPKYDKNYKEIVYKTKEFFNFYKIIEKDFFYQIKIFKANTSDDNKKIIKLINECDIVVVFYQIDSRESFEDLGKYFLFLKNECGYQNKIVLLANYYKNTDMLTSDEEITHFIKKINMNNTLLYKKINVKDSNTLAKEFDLILEDYKKKFKDLLLKKDEPWNDY